MDTGAKSENSNVPCESHTLIYLLGLRLIPEASTVGWVAVDELGTVILPAPPPPNPPMLNILTCAGALIPLTLMCVVAWVG